MLIYFTIVAHPHTHSRTVRAHVKFVVFRCFWVFGGPPHQHKFPRTTRTTRNRFPYLSQGKVFLSRLPALSKWSHKNCESRKKLVNSLHVTRSRPKEWKCDPSKDLAESFPFDANQRLKVAYMEIRMAGGGVCMQCMECICV